MVISYLLFNRRIALWLMRGADCPGWILVTEVKTNSHFTYILVLENPVNAEFLPAYRTINKIEYSVRFSFTEGGACMFMSFIAVGH